MGDSNIEWTDKTWNPIRGCSRVSAGCMNCYAEAIATRFSGPGQAYEGLVDVKAVDRHGENGRSRTGVKGLWNGTIRFLPEKLREPPGWKEPCRVFVNSMSDLFHENVQNDWLDAIFGVMAQANQHVFQILTKRPDRALHYLRERGSVLPNVWLGTSVENQATAFERIPVLLETPAAVRFVSVEPLLAPVSLEKWVLVRPNAPWLTRLSWVIVGGESGSHARSFDLQWARRIVQECQAGQVPVFVKQMGSNPKDAHFGSKKGGDPDEWPEDLRVRQFPTR